MRRAAAGSLLAVTIGSCLAACSDDEPRADGLSEAEKGAQVAVDEFVDALEHSFVDGATAAVAFDIRGRARLRGSGVVRYDEDGMDVDLRLADWQVRGGSVSLRTVDGATYLKVPESRGLWVDVTAQESLLPGEVMAEADPRSQFDTLRGVITEVRFIGADTVAGEPARRYQVVTEPGETEGAGGSAPTTTEYWLDEDQRVVRRQTDLGATGTATFTWTAWGDPVTIAPPPSDRVVTLRELERLRGQDPTRR